MFVAFNVGVQTALAKFAHQNVYLLISVHIDVASQLVLITFVEYLVHAKHVAVLAVVVMMNQDPLQLKH